MTTHVQKWGNSLAVRLPKDLLEKISLKEGEAVSIESKGGALVLRPSIKLETLESMLKKVTAKNRHPEMDWGAPVGNEIW